MKNNIHFWSYLVQFFSEWEMLQIEVLEKIKTHFSSITLFLLKIIQFMRIWKNVESGRPQMTIWCTHIACWVTKATDTYSQYVILLFHCYNGCMYVPQCYVICTLPILFLIWIGLHIKGTKIVFVYCDILKLWPNICLPHVVRKSTSEGL